MTGRLFDRILVYFLYKYIENTKIPKQILADYINIWSDTEIKANN